MKSTPMVDFIIEDIVMKKEPRLGHYVPNMLEDWEAFRGRCLQLKVPEAAEDKQKLLNEAISSCNMVIELLNDAVCWTISEQAFPFIWNTDFMNADYENVRLPYRTMAIEYDFDFAVAVGNPTPAFVDRDSAPKRIILLTEIDDEKFLLLSAYKPTTGDAGLKMVGFHMPLRFPVSPIGFLFHYKALENIGEWLKVEDDRYFMSFSKEYLLTCPALPMYTEALEESSDKDHALMIKDMADEMRLALGLLAILNCENAPVERIPAPAKLNKKRMKTGKPMIPEYRTLHISGHVSRPKGDSVGSHASPCTHWRRGHIRNQKTAKGYVRRWIKPTIVNPEGGAAPKPEVVLT